MKNIIGISAQACNVKKIVLRSAKDHIILNTSIRKSFLYRILIQIYDCFFEVLQDNDQQET